MDVLSSELEFLSSANSILRKSIEQYHEGVRAMWLAEKGGQVYKHPYDIGAYENLTLVIILIFFRDIVTTWSKV